MILKYIRQKTYYTILNYYDSETYHKVVILIMEQLVNFGPVTAQIGYYKDLVELGLKVIVNLLYINMMENLNW